MRNDTASILLWMGYQVDVDFFAVQDAAASVNVVWLSHRPQPTPAEIDAARPSAEAAEAARIAAEQQAAADRAELRAQFQTAADRLQQIADAASPTNAQVVAAVRDLATIQRRMLRALYGILTD